MYFSPFSPQILPHISPILLFSFCSLLFPSIAPLHNKPIFAFLVFVVTPGCIYTSKNLGAKIPEERNHLLFVFMSLHYLTQYDLFCFSTFTLIFHDFNFFNFWIVFRCIHIPHLAIYLSVEGHSGLFPFPRSCPWSDSEPGWADIYGVGCPVFGAYTWTIW